MFRRLLGIGDRAEFTVTIRHSATSANTAYDVQLNVTLPSGVDVLSADNGFKRVDSVIVLDLLLNISLNQSSDVAVVLNVTDSILGGTTLTGTASLVYFAPHPSAQLVSATRKSYSLIKESKPAYVVETTAQIQSSFLANQIAPYDVLNSPVSIMEPAAFNITVHVSPLVNQSFRIVLSASESLGTITQLMDVGETNATVNNLR